MKKQLKHQPKAFLHVEETLPARQILERAVRLHKTIKRLEKTADALHQETHKTQKKTDIAQKKFEPRSNLLFPIVGIGASAGGLEAMTQLLKKLPPDTGMAFVVVQHLDPTHESALTSLLARATQMPVAEVKNNVRLEPDCVYVLPPNKAIEISDLHFKLLPRREGKMQHLPIDQFFRSLAQADGGSVVGVVLSGNGADGTAGLLAIKAAGGVTFAQDEKTAKFQAMPVNAVASGCVDFVLPPEKIARELRRIAGHLGRLAMHQEDQSETPRPEEEKFFQEILLLLRQRMAVDFTHYKHATLRRRIVRRMTLHKLESLKEYVHYLRAHPGEVKELFHDILIHVTGFFRDPAVFQTLKRKLLPRLLRDKAPEEPVRIWIPGCSTGEEVYSLAISLMELMAGKKTQHPVQIFGTDINEKALQKARAGFYPENLCGDISPDRLRRFFVRSEGGFRVNKTIREMCIFARQNLAADPPFSNLDLVSCRNVLIYLGPTLQRKIMPVFHYALRPGGFLMLGASETIGSYADLFALTDSKAKIYSKKDSSRRAPVSFGYSGLPETKIFGDGEPAAHVPQIPTAIPDVQKQADRIVLTAYSPAGVVINRQLEVLQFRGRTGLFLEHPHGEPNLNVLKLAREGLALDLRATISKAMKQNARTRQEHVRVKQNGHSLECSIEVIPFNVPPAAEKFYLVLFHSAEAIGEDGQKKKKSDARKSVRPVLAESGQLTSVREELAATRDSLQAIIEEQEATNEELRSANEEITSSNEELQSTNEELETAKEELQSTNEELTTLNDEQEDRNRELEQVNNDLHNLLASVSIPVIILGADLRIRRFTAAAEKMFKLIPADIGRPITDIALPLELPNLEKQMFDLFDSLAPKDLELQDKQGHWWSLRIRAYKTTDHKIDGAVLALTDIDLLKTSVDHHHQSRAFAEAVVNTVREPLLVLDKTLVVKFANEAFYKFFKAGAEDTIGRNIYELGNGQWNIPKLRTLLEDILPKNTALTDFDVEHDFARLGRRKILLNARRLTLTGDAEDMVMLAMEDVTGAAK